MTDRQPSRLPEETGEPALKALVTNMGPLVRGLRIGVLVVSADHTVLLTNEALVTQLGLRAKPAELAGLRTQDMLRLRLRPADHYREFDAFVDDCVEHGEPRHGVELSFGPDETIEVDFVPFRTGGEPTGSLWGIRNVTERTGSRRALVCRDEELSRLAALKTEFLSIVSHELRTPLTALTGLAELLAAVLGEEEVAIGDALVRNVRRMNTLVETLTLLARVESRTLPLYVGHVDLDELLRHQIAEVSPMADAMSVRVRLTEDTVAPATIGGDEELLGKMIHHALVSVISGPGPGATVTVRSQSDDDLGRWRVKITRSHTDTTPLPFTTHPQPGDGSPPIGSGLGIAVARAISERHGGVVVTEPAEHGDHIVRIELPLGQTHDPVAATLSELCRAVQ